MATHRRVLPGLATAGALLVAATTCLTVSYAGGPTSPCGGAQGVDPSYPYPKAQIGVWGYDLLTQKLYNPGAYTDVMGYCQPIWVSDFTYVGLMDRIKAVNQARIIVPPELRDRTYDRAYIDLDGELHWLSPIRMELPPQGEAVDIDVEVGDAITTLTAQFYPYSHLPGGVYVWPQAGAPSQAVTVEWEGAWKTLFQGL